ncbi:hypothetical protein CK203_069071 [Vitis vinifera]|uniref:Uncharacterized protein n=1 Tax=Vitis vinifera TaxID=29760 RepID=A0A438F171_VITVI|nr:hypothetical protein CK203_069071 [Vitis vinifera]
MNISDLESNTLCHVPPQESLLLGVQCTQGRRRLGNKNKNKNKIAISLCKMKVPPCPCAVEGSESLSSHNSHLHVKEKRSNAPPSAAKIPKSCVKNLAAVRSPPMPVSSKGIGKNDKHTGEDEKQSGRACSVPRLELFYLVLSLKQNRHVQIKEIPIHGKAGSPPSMRKREAPNTNSRLKQRNSSEPPHLGQKPRPRKVESSIRV